MKRWLITAGLALTGCTELGELGTLVSTIEGGQTFSGRVAGSAAADPSLKVLVVPGTGSDPTGGAGRVIPAPGGSFSFQANPDRERHLTVFAFIDTDGNGRFDVGEASTFGATGGNSYLQLSWTGTAWDVSEVRSGTSVSLRPGASLSMIFNG